jgi:hypothetical protein
LPKGSFTKRASGRSVMARRAWPVSLLLVALFAGCTGGVHTRDLRRQIDYGANDYVARSVHLDDGFSEEKRSR